MTCPGFPATDPATAGIPSLFGRNGTSRVERVSGGRKSIPPPQRAFHSTPSVLHMRHIHSLLVNRNDHAWAAGLCVWGAPPASAAKGAAAKRPLGGVLRLCDIWKVRRVQFFLAAAIGAQSHSSSRIKRPRRNRSVFSLTTRLAVPRRHSRFTHSNEQHGEEKG